MTAQRWPWFACGALLIAAGVAAGVATYLWWLPCRGQMLLGAHLWAFPEGAEFTEACLRRMDEGTAFPGPGYGLNAVPGLLFCTIATVLLTAAAWLVPVLAQPLRPLVRAVFLIPGALLIGVGLVVAQSPEASARDAVGEARATEISTALIELLALALAVVIAMLAAKPWRDAAPWVFAVAAMNSFSIVGVMIDYVLMGLWSEANWDSPPGSGYPTAGWLLLCGLVLIVLTRRDRLVAASPVPASRPIVQGDAVA